MYALHCSETFYYFGCDPFINQTDNFNINSILTNYHFIDSKKQSNTVAKTLTVNSKIFQYDAGLFPTTKIKLTMTAFEQNVHKFQQFVDIVEIT